VIASLTPGVLPVWLPAGDVVAVDGVIKNHGCFCVNNDSCFNCFIGFIWLFLMVI
jgi:hypothetical protein